MRFDLSRVITQVQGRWFSWWSALWSSMKNSLENFKRHLVRRLCLKVAIDNDLKWLDGRRTLNWHGHLLSIFWHHKSDSNPTHTQNKIPMKWWTICNQSFLPPIRFGSGNSTKVPFLFWAAQVIKSPFISVVDLAMRGRQNVADFQAGPKDYAIKQIRSLRDYLKARVFMTTANARVLVHSVVLGIRDKITSSMLEVYSVVLSQLQCVFSRVLLPWQGGWGYVLVRVQRIRGYGAVEEGALRLLRRK